MAWRTENYSQAEAERWAKESVSEIFELNNMMAKGGEVNEDNMEIKYQFNHLKKMAALSSFMFSFASFLEMKDLPNYSKFIFRRPYAKN